LSSVWSSFAIPHIHSKFGFALAYCVIGFVEGVILVSTPALMRDFSPQMGRGAAMGFWALGPTMGALAASLVATHTLTTSSVAGPVHHLGLVCMAVVVIAFFFLRELSPRLRDQLMVSEKTAHCRGSARGHLGRGRGHRAPDSLHDPARPDLVVVGDLAALAVLLRVGQRAHPLLGGRLRPVHPRRQWHQRVVRSVLSGSLVLFGVLSDRLRVRKPFMLVGAVACIVMMVFLILQVGHPHTGYYSNVLVIVLLGVAIGCAYAPWMANYTEQVESHNPALTAPVWLSGAGSCELWWHCPSSSSRGSSPPPRRWLTTRERPSHCRRSRRRCRTHPPRQHAPRRVSPLSAS
jgi:MFS family permease